MLSFKGEKVSENRKIVSSKVRSGRTAFNPVLGRQMPVDCCEFRAILEHSELSDSQDYIEKPYVKKTRTREQGIIVLF